MNIYSSRVSNLLLREQEVGNRWKCIRPPRTCAYPECKIKTCNVNASSRHIESHPPSFDPSSKCTLGSRCTLFVYIPFHPPSISPPGDGCPLPLRPRQFSMSRITRCRFLFFQFFGRASRVFGPGAGEESQSGPVYAAGNHVVPVTWSNERAYVKHVPSMRFDIAGIFLPWNAIGQRES